VQVLLRSWFSSLDFSGIETKTGTVWARALAIESDRPTMQRLRLEVESSALRFGAPNLNTSITFDAVIRDFRMRQARPHLPKSFARARARGDPDDRPVGKWKSSSNWTLALTFLMLNARLSQPSVLKEIPPSQHR